MYHSYYVIIGLWKLDLVEFCILNRKYVHFTGMSFSISYPLFTYQKSKGKVNCQCVCECPGDELTGDTMYLITVPFTHLF